MHKLSTAFLCTIIGIVATLLYITVQGPIGMAVFFFCAVPCFIMAILQTVCASHSCCKKNEQC